MLLVVMFGVGGGGCASILISCHCFAAVFYGNLVGNINSGTFNILLIIYLP